MRNKDMDQPSASKINSSIKPTLIVMTHPPNIDASVPVYGNSPSTDEQVNKM